MIKIAFIGAEGLKRTKMGVQTLITSGKRNAMVEMRWIRRDST